MSQLGDWRGFFLLFNVNILPLVRQKNIVIHKLKLTEITIKGLTDQQPVY